MPIRILDAATVGRIAAGEVVERPSSVVKELIENALDAGATAVTVEMRGGGIDYLRVTDNGCGIEPGQVRLAFENHATSKIQRAEQLDDIRTLGFRGEALPSIAAVSCVEMTTRARGQESGMKLTAEGGENMNVREVGCPQGTTFIMRDLFFNVPVRRAFLKKPSYEGGLVSDAVARMLLGNPGVSVRLISGGNTLYHSFGDGNLRHAVFSVYGREAAEGMVALDAAEGGTRIQGLIGVGELCKATRAHELFFINGRSVRCPLLAKALEEVCRSRVTIGMYPMCALNLTVPPSSVDVNVHPNKLEVRFRDAEAMRAACERLLARTFEGERVLQIEKLTSERPHVEPRVEVRELPLADAEVQNAADAPVQTAKAVDAGNESGESTVREAFKPQTRPLPKPRQMELDLRPAGSMLREDPLAPDSGAPLKVIETRKSGDASEVNQPSKASAQSAAEANWPSKSDAQSVAEASRSLKADADSAAKPAPTAEARRTPPFRVIGVAFKTYILVEALDSLLLIDQHAAHERLQYEKYMARAREGTASQQLLTPLVFQLSAREMASIQENLDVLADAGYAVEPFGERDVRVTAVPFVMGRAEIRPLFAEMAQSLGRLKAATVDVRRGEIMQMACKSAVKGGDVLSDSEIAALIEGMLETGAPPTCPHGRPVAKAISRRELEKMFKRIQ